MSFQCMVTNLSPQLQESHLRELFEVCGELVGIRRVPTQGPTGSYIVEFKTEEGAKAATLISGTPLGDPPIPFTVKLATGDAVALAFAPRESEEDMSSAAQQRADEIARTIYVGNLDINVAEDTVRNFFAQLGRVLYCKLGGETEGKTARFAFVEFDSVASAQASYGLSGQILDGRAIKVGKANNPIFKPDQQKPTVVNMSEVERKLQMAQAAIKSKVETVEKRRSRSRSRSRSDSRGRRKRKKRSRYSRSRSRSSSRSPSRGRRSRRRRRSRSGSREKRRERDRRRKVKERRRQRSLSPGEDPVKEGSRSRCSSSQCT